MVKANQNLHGNVSNVGTVAGALSNNHEKLDGVVGISTGGVTEQYTGEYEVTPLITEQTLPTKKKVMTEDLTIKEIPFFNVSNTSGGTTVFIGKEL